MKNKLPISAAACDFHSFDKNSDKPLILGGFKIYGTPRLKGHSDGDALLHAICDSLLMAGGLGDMGSNFGSNNMQYKNAPSKEFIKAALEKLKSKGFAPYFISAQIIAEKPRLSAFRLDIQNNISQIFKDFGIETDISIAITSTDKMGFIGRGEGIACFAASNIFKI